MRRNIPTIFAILALLSLILCSACVSPLTANQMSQQNDGLKVITVTAESPFISFDVALQNLREYRPDPGNEAKTIETEGTFKVVKSAPKTIAKKLIEKQMQGKTQALRRFAIDNFIGSIKLQGETIEIE